MTLVYTTPKQISLCINNKAECVFLQACLQSAGHHIVVFDHLSHLFSYTGNHFQNLIIMDYGVDNSDGMSAGIEIYRNSLNINMPLLFIASKGVEVIYPEHFSDKFVSWTYKPFTCSWIRSYITKLFEHQRLAEHHKTEGLSLIQQNANSCRGHILLGRSFEVLGNYSNAINIYNKAVQMNADCAEAFLRLGYCLFQQRRFEEATTAFKSAINIDKNYAEAYFFLGVALEALDDYAEAEKSWLRAIETGDNDLQEKSFRRLQRII